MDSHYDYFIFAVSLIGFVSVCKPIFTFLNWIRSNFLRRPKNLKEYGTWAVITGATDGIGKTLAFELASKGLNLILIGRNPRKLEDTSNEIRDEYGHKSIEIRSINIDFARFSGEEVSKAVEEGVKGLDVGILINNAGLAYAYGKYLHEVDKELAEDIIKVNIDGATRVTKSVIPIMLKKKRGAIVNIGSASASAIPSYPLFTIYAASKAYLAMFTRSIYVEYKQRGVDIQCQIPIFVATKMTKFRKSSFFIPSAEAYSKASVRWIGYEHLCMAYWTHYLQWCIIQAFPDALVNWYVFRLLLRFRKRAIEKLSNESKG